MNFEKILEIIISPSFIIIIIFLCLKNEIKKLLSAFSEHFLSSTQLKFKYKNIEVTSEKKGEIINNISKLKDEEIEKLTYNSNTEQSPDKIKNKITHDLSENDLNTFLSLFYSSDLVVDRDEFIRNSIYLRLSDLQLIKKNYHLPPAYGITMPQIAWEITDIGRLVRKFYKKDS